MCTHDEFEVFYDGGILIRRCKICGAIEVSTDFWVSTEKILEAIKKVNH